MDSQDILRPLAKFGGRVQLIGAVVLVLGILAVTSPTISGMTISVIVGILLILSGVARTAFAWLSPGWGSLFLKALVGIVTIVAGGYMIANPDVGSRALAIVLTVYLFADGIATLIFAIRLPPAAGGAWMLLGSVASLVAGVLMWMQWPASGELAIGILIGIKLIIDGIELIGVGSAAKAAVS
ncbi:MAG: HdeD family acid-resistance protein [Gammaproteobacteria bacterium]